MPSAARSRLCKRDSARAGVFARSAMGDAVWTCGLSMNHGNLSLAMF